MLERKSNSLKNKTTKRHNQYRQNQRKGGKEGSVECTGQRHNRGNKISQKALSNLKEDGLERQKPSRKVDGVAFVLACTKAAGDKGGRVKRQDYRLMGALISQSCEQAKKKKPKTIVTPSNGSPGGGRKKIRRRRGEFLHRSQDAITIHILMDVWARRKLEGPGRSNLFGVATELPDRLHIL